MGFNLVLSNAGETLINWVSLAIFAVTNDRAYTEIKKITAADYPAWINPNYT
jgi:hypothetical protein